MDELFNGFPTPIALGESAALNLIEKLNIGGTMSFLRIPNKNYNEIEDNDISLAEAAIDILMESGQYTPEKINKIAARANATLNQFTTAIRSLPLERARKFKQWSNKVENLTNLDHEVSSRSKIKPVILDRYRKVKTEFIAIANATDIKPTSEIYSLGIKVAAEVLVLARAKNMYYNSNPRPEIVPEVNERNAMHREGEHFGRRRHRMM